MSLQTKQFYEFADFRLDPSEKILFRKNTPVPLTPKVFDTLKFLVENAGRLIEQDELMNKLWQDRFVEKGNLTFNIKMLRKALGDDAAKPSFIETVQRRGYRFIADVRHISTGDNAAEKLPEAQNLVEPVNRQPRPVIYPIAGVLAVVIVALSGFFIWNSIATQDPSASPQISPLQFETVTSSGIATAAISPDGAYIAFTNTTNGKESLWLRQLSSGVNTQIVAQENDVRYLNIEFSPDGRFIYFSRRHKDDGATLARVSVSDGNIEANTLTDLDGTFSISRDYRISFRRRDAAKRLLLTANTDGSDAKTIYEIAALITDNTFSPDGKTIAFASGQTDTGERDFGVFIVDAETGVVKPATDFRWFYVRGILWLPDQSGLLVTGRTDVDETQQVWKISLNTGEVERITESQSSFGVISGTADLSRILLIQTTLSSNLFRASVNAPDNFQLVTNSFGGMSWAPDGNIVYSSKSSGNHDIWLLDANSENQKQLTSERSAEMSPVVSPDGRHIVFVSNRGGRNNLWRVNADGSSPVQLTDSTGEQAPVFTPDGKFVAFNLAADRSLWKVQIEGGDPVQISSEPTYKVSFSPDGTKYAHYKRRNGKIDILVKSFENNHLITGFVIPDGFTPSTSKTVWANDGDALIYAIEDANLIANLWRQPLTGGKPEQLTNYSSDEIFDFDLSPDAAQLAFIRGSWRHDVVLVSGFQK